jgi:hypothetical protein
MNLFAMPFSADPNPPADRRNRVPVAAEKARK